MALQDFTGERGAVPRRSNVVKSVFLSSVNTHGVRANALTSSSVREPRTNTLTNRYVSQIIYNQAHRDHRFLRSFGIQPIDSTFPPRITHPRGSPSNCRVNCRATSTRSRSIEIEDSIALLVVCSRFRNAIVSLLCTRRGGEKESRFSGSVTRQAGRGGSRHGANFFSLLSSRVFFFFFLSYTLSSNDFSFVVVGTLECERGDYKGECGGKREYLREAFAYIHIYDNTPTLPVARSRADCETATARGFHLRPCSTPFAPLSLSLALSPYTCTGRVPTDFRVCEP